MKNIAEECAEKLIGKRKTPKHMKRDSRDAYQEIMNSEEWQKKDSTITCDCGNKELLVNLLMSGWSGCFLKVKCPKCKKEEILYDDYA